MTVRWLARGLDEVPPGDLWLSGGERERVAAMRFAKRRTEFLVSRFAAKLAIAGALDRPTDDPRTLADIEIRRKPTGAPAPFVDGERADLSMSQTDRADWAVCVVRRGSPVALGCDLELLEPRSPGFVRDYLTAAEHAAVAASREPDLVANLLWSAKESALKVLETGLRRDTRSVEVTLLTSGTGTDGATDASDPADAPDAAVGTTQDVWHPLEVRPVEGGVFPGWWQRAGMFLLSVVTSAPTGPPRTVDRPPGLAAALPTHRWMDDLGD